MISTETSREEDGARGAVRIEGRPVITRAHAEQLSGELFLVVGKASSLPSYSDANFRIDTDSGERFVLKVFNSHQDAAELKLQQKALALAHDAGVPVPRLVPAAGDREEVRVEIVEGGQEYVFSPQMESGGGAGDRHSHVVWMASYIPGTPLAEINPVSDYLLSNLGATLARLDCALEGLDHPVKAPSHPWDLRSAGETISALSEWVSQEDRDAIDRVRLGFEEARGRLASLALQVIHADANDYNILVVEAGTLPRRLAGIIDFGDLSYSWRVGEVAIACAYAMMYCGNALSAAGKIVEGYNSVSELSDPEIDALFILIRARLAMSLCMSARKKMLEPDNSYLTVSEVPVRRLIHELDSINPEIAAAGLRCAVGREPFPAAAPLRRWLFDHREDFDAVITPDPRLRDPVVFDFSAGSTEWDADALMNPGVAGREIEARIHNAQRGLQDESQAENVLGIGRYNEARLVYAGDQYATGGDDSPERRTVHLGMDLFAPPGTPVSAPLDGIVHAVARHDLPFDYGPTVILSHARDDGPEFYTLYGHLQWKSISALTPGQCVTSGEQFAALGDPQENGGWVSHLHFQVMASPAGHTDTFPGVAAPSERDLWLSLCPDPNLIIGVPDRCFPGNRLSSEDILALRRLHTSAALSLSYDAPLHFVRGRMQYLFDVDGQAWLDAVNNVPHVGHSHPHVVSAVHAQSTALSTNTRYLHETFALYCARLADLAPDPLDVVFLVNSGSEANDLALRLAYAHTLRSQTIVVEGAYHGNLSSLVDISHYKYAGPGGAGPPSSTVAVPTPDPYRGTWKGYDALAGRAYASTVSRSITDDTAAFMVESVPGCAGQIILPDEYLKTAFQTVRECGGVCICDEVQVGMGRVGTHFWGFELQGVVPDIVTLGKPIGNGHPLGAVITTREIADSFANGMEYFNTFGGNPVSCAAGMAVLDVLEEDNLQAHAHDVGSYLKAGLVELQNDHAIIGDVRGTGLFIGVELVRNRNSLEPAADEASYVVNRACRQGILLSTDGPLHNVIKIKPPMVFSRDDADRLVRTLNRILEEDPVRARLS
jgi:4-aminobutyrate aminotransferase-like enzyme/Ser/Thr protein kinase RdoA (MazF antagonist)